MIYYGSLDASKGEGILSIVQRSFKLIYEPALKAYDDWGELSRTAQGKKTCNEFLDTCHSFVGALQSKFKHVCDCWHGVQGYLFNMKCSYFGSQE